MTTRGHGEHRIAILIPFLSNSLTMLPPYFPIFLQTARGSDSLIDFLIIHNGQLSPWIDEAESTIQGFDVPDNVKFVDLKSMENFVKYLLRVVDHRLDGDAQGNEQLLQIVSGVLNSIPYALVEFKPAMGYIFEEFIQGYTHWGYSDFDIAFGDLPRWITKDELENHDIVTYSYGDQERIYLRGQFTFHKNLKNINNIWRKCSYLSEMDLRYARVVSGEEKFRLISAEGCYSNAVITTTDIRVKYAVKAMTDVKDHNDNSYDYGISIATGRKGDKSVVYKAGDGVKSGERFLKLSKTWFEEDKNYRKHDLQWEAGELVPLADSKKGPGCMYWVMKEYQSNICYKNISNKDTVFLIDGALYKQPFEELPFPSGIQTRAFFHFQEWKRSYRSDQLLAFSRPTNHYDHLGWHLFPEGAALLVSSSNLFSKLRISLNKQRTTHTSILSSTQHCLVSSGRKNHLSPVCDFAVSWRNVVTRVSQDWENVKEDGVTLVLTLRLDSDHQTNDLLLLTILETNMKLWQNNPVIVLLYVSGYEDRSVSALERIDQMISDRSSYLVGIVRQPTGDRTVSLNAMLNMAESARRTRWVVSGIEIERGLLLSREALLFTKRAASMYKDTPGSVFVLPQMAVNDHILKQKQNINTPLSPVSINDMLEDHRNNKNVFSNLAEEVDCHCDDAIREQDIEKRMNNIWMDLSMKEVYQSPDEGTFMTRDEVAVRARAAIGMQTTLASILDDENRLKLLHFDKHPLLMMDMLGPAGMVTEVTDLPDKCTNGLRLARLSVLDCQVMVLPGAFAVSLPAFRSKCPNPKDWTQECELCGFQNNAEDISRIIQEESVLTAKTASLYQLL